MNEETQGLNRREVLQAAAGAGALLLLPAASRAKDADPVKDAARWTPVGKTSDFALNVPTRVAVGGLALSVTRAGEKDANAVSLKCTHRGCEVGWESATSEYDCPCHGARFAADGKCLAGTRRSPTQLLDSLATAPARIAGDEVQVDISAFPAGGAAPAG